MPLTRAQIKADVLDLMGEDGGTGDLLDRPAMQDTWLNKAADEIARATYCFYTAQSQDTAAGQAGYSAPQIFDIQSAYVTGRGGEPRPLSFMTPQQMDYSFPHWRGMLPGQSARLVMGGANALSLWPAPAEGSFVAFCTDLALSANGGVTSAARPFAASDVGLSLRFSAGCNPTGSFFPGFFTILSVAGGAAFLSSLPGVLGSTGGVAVLTTGGLTIAGYGVPGDTWPLPGQNCPLPDRAHTAVMWRTAIFRTIQFPTPENAARLPLLREEYKRDLGSLEREMHSLTSAQNTADFQGRGFRRGY